MQLFYGTLKGVEDLRSKFKVPDFADLKKRVEVLVIDDGKVPFLDILIQNDYRIKQTKDLKDIRAVFSYDIILCDVLGVGKTLNPTLQGAHIVKEIRKLFPFKQVVAFTASQTDPLLTSALREADFMMPKDADEDTWIQTLDECIRNHADPIKQWLRVRTILLSAKVPTKTVALLESRYVEALLNKKESLFLNEKEFSELIPKHLLDILKEFTAGVLLKYLIGV